tara:strand:- start:1263 stop:2438 length:1176 start_codon:yes stop_codon:yes gene_type:complete
MKKNFLLLFFSIIFSLIFIYLLSYGYIYLNLDKNISYKFSSIKTLNFHKNYSSKIHHLRWINEKDFKNKYNQNEYLFSIFNSFKKDQKNILFQGDSWAENLSSLDSKNLKANEFAKKFVKEKNIGFINGGITSFSPTLMKLQLQILESDFQIKPNIIIAYIDQTDIGDENCRYKKYRIFKNNEVVGVRLGKYSSSPFQYSKIYGESEIFLQEKTKLKKAYDLLNFKIKYKYEKSKNKNLTKLKKLLENEPNRTKESKCYWPDIQRYLVNSNDQEIDYFKETINNYISYIDNNKNIENLFIVTFPHKNHIKKFLNNSDIAYKYNVSNIVDQLIENKKKVKHLNFTNLVNYENFPLEIENYQKNDPSSHLNEDYYNNFFIKKILDYVFNNIKT